MEPTFTSIFQNATGSDNFPYPYQEHLENRPWLDIIDIPTVMPTGYFFILLSN